MKSTNPKPSEFTKRANERAREQRQTDFLRYLAQGESITEACVLVGIVRSTYEHWRKRHREFRAAVESARESHRRDILSGFHTADAYARMLLDAIQRDESLPAALRYRASKAILSRKGKVDWLPEPLPADAAPLAPFEDEEDQQPNASPHAGAAPAPSTTGPALTGITSSDSLAPAYGSNPENPDKTPCPQFGANVMEHQQDALTQRASGHPAKFCVNPDKPLPGPFTEIHAVTHPNERPPAVNAAALPAAILSQTWLGVQLHCNHESPKPFETVYRNPLPVRPFLNPVRTDSRPQHHEGGFVPKPGKARV
ncbi:MAG: helix-turn-helix domain-containing protein [Bryobacterales bacterium]|nr:helix-turn-helix domain-containing protein [Bryobacterales bacterium]